MIPYPHIDPVIFRIGPLAVRWYGIMYVLGFASSYLLVLYQIKKKAIGITREQIDDLYFYLILGLLIGSRLGYAIFYNLPFYLESPWEIFILWHGGMSFHGGAIGTFVAGYLVMRKRGLKFFNVADVITPTIPIGLGLGRIGNFINGELFGRVTESRWGMIFPDGGPLPRHASQLYEAFLEGFILFVILWWYKDRKSYQGDVFALFLILYGIFRSFCELFREPDTQLGYLFGALTMGQILSVSMIALGFLLRYLYIRRAGKPSTKAHG